MNCPGCNRHVTPVKPRTAWKVLNVVFWTGSLMVAVPFGTLIGLNLVLAPLAIAIGMSIGASARRLTSWTCPNCHAELLEPEAGTVLTAAPLASIAH